METLTASRGIFRGWNQTSAITIKNSHHDAQVSFFRSETLSSMPRERAFVTYLRYFWEDDDSSSRLKDCLSSSKSVSASQVKILSLALYKLMDPGERCCSDWGLYHCCGRESKNASIFDNLNFFQRQTVSASFATQMLIQNSISKQPCTMVKALLLVLMARHMAAAPPLVFDREVRSFYARQRHGSCDA